MKIKIILFFVLVLFINLNAQERTFVSSYSNSERKNLTNGKKSFKFTLARSHKTEKDVNNLYYIADQDTISVSLNTEIDKYNITKYGSKNIGKFENIETDKIEYNFNTKFDVSITNSVVYFKEGNKVKAKIGFSGGWYNGSNTKIEATKQSLVGNKLSFEFPENITSSKTDTFGWTPIGLGNDCYIDETTPGGTNNTTTLYMLNSGGQYDWVLVQFVGLEDSIGEGSNIENSTLSIYNYANGSTEEIYGIPSNKLFAEATETWNSFNEDTVTGRALHTPITSSSGTGLYWEWDVENMVQAWVDGFLTNNGTVLKYSNGGDTQWSGRSSEYGSNEPFIYSEYTLPLTLPQLVDSMNVLRAEWPEDISDTSQILRPEWKSDISDTVQTLGTVDVAQMIRDSFNTVSADSNQALGVGFPDSVGAYYSFDNIISNNIIIDYSGKGNHGTNNGMIQMIEAGSVIVGLGAGKFNYIAGVESSYVDIFSVLDNVRNSEAGIIAGYVNLPTITDIYHLFSAGDNNADTRYSLMISNGIVTANFRINGVQQFTLNTTNPINSNTDYYLTLKQNGISPIILIDGKIVPQSFSNSTNTTVWFRNASGIDMMTIGALRWNNFNIQFMNGTLDEFIVSNDTSTQQEILRYVLNPENYNLFNTKTKPIPFAY